MTTKIKEKLRVHLVGWVEKWEDRKQEKNRKVGGQKRFSFQSFVFGWKDGKVEKWKPLLFG